MRERRFDATQAADLLLREDSGEPPQTYEARLALIVPAGRP
jgi:hypothetical protein